MYFEVKFSKVRIILTIRVSPWVIVVGFVSKRWVSSLGSSIGDIFQSVSGKGNKNKIDKWKSVNGRYQCTRLGINASCVEPK
jgi:hypothetical protein